MKQNASQEIPGIPLPSKKDHSPYIDLIVMASVWANKQKGAPRPISDQIADLIIYESFLNSETEEWIGRFRDAQNKAGFLYRDPNTYWRTIALGVSTPQVEKVCLELLPNLDREKYFQHNITAPSPQKITPQPALKETSQSRGYKTRGPEHISTILPRTYVPPEVYWGEKQKRSPQPRPREPKGIPPTREETIVRFITNHAPSIDYLQVFIFISRHTKNRLSGRGRKVYPYGQKYVVRKLEISLRTVKRIFSWLRRQGIIIKRSNENHDLHKSATWFVCTSWKQSFYFRDPEGRRQKKGSPRSRRK